MSRARMGRMAAVALAFCLAGCGESSPFRLGGLRRGEVAEGPPQPAPALFIPKAPSIARIERDEQVKQATHVPIPDAPMQPLVDSNPQMFEHPLRVLYQRAAQRYAAMDTYSFRLKRRESLNGVKQAEESISVHVRREPYSVRLQWLNEKAKGREMIYVQGRYDNKVEILLAPTDPLAKAGRRHAIAPDFPLLRAESRYAITEAGFGPLVERFGRVIAGVERGDPREGAAKYLGKLSRPEFEATVEAVHQVIPAGADPLFPKGGQRWWFFDPVTGLPALIVAHDASGEVEYYLHDQIQTSATLGDGDFDPARVWRK